MSKTSGFSLAAKGPPFVKACSSLDFPVRSAGSIKEGDRVRYTVTQEPLVGWVIFPAKIGKSIGF